MKRDCASLSRKQETIFDAFRHHSNSISNIERWYAYVHAVTIIVVVNLYSSLFLYSSVSFLVALKLTLFTNVTARYVKAAALIAQISFSVSIFSFLIIVYLLLAVRYSKGLQSDNTTKELPLGSLLLLNSSRAYLKSGILNHLSDKILWLHFILDSLVLILVSTFAGPSLSIGAFYIAVVFFLLCSYFWCRENSKIAIADHNSSYMLTAANDLVYNNELLEPIDNKITGDGCNPIGDLQKLFRINEISRHFKRLFFYGVCGLLSCIIVFFASEGNAWLMDSMRLNQLLLCLGLVSLLAAACGWFVLLVAIPYEWTYYKKLEDSVEHFEGSLSVLPSEHYVLQNIECLKERHKKTVLKRFLFPSIIIFYGLCILLVVYVKRVSIQGVSILLSPLPVIFVVVTLYDNMMNRSKLLEKTYNILRLGCPSQKLNQQCDEAEKINVDGNVSEDN